MKDKKDQKYLRRHTVEVTAGNLKIGANNPIALQSMTNTNTLDAKATAEQCKKIADAGADLVRITAQTVKAAGNFKYIRNELYRLGVDIPISADIHFSPKAAMEAALHADKVRINPGNFADSKKFSVRTYTNAEYEAEKERIDSVFLPFLERCKVHGRSIRIGVNHGSLSDRIMSRYGDTTRGMVESAMEYLRICKRIGFDQVVLSMKANNPPVMIEANRMLVKAMAEEDMHFPLHIGVTEAGEGEDGRIKSAVGIGALLADGIGDTIRVSLTEDPEKEIPVAEKLRELLSLPKVENLSDRKPEFDCNPKKRKSRAVNIFGGNNKPLVLAKLPDAECGEKTLSDLGFIFSEGIWQESDLSPDVLLIPEWTKRPDDLSENVKWMSVCNYDSVVSNSLNDKRLLRFQVENYSDLKIGELGESDILIAEFSEQTLWPVQTGRKMLKYLEEKSIYNPLIISFLFDDISNDYLLKSSAFLGSLMADYGGDGILLTNRKFGSSAEYVNTAFGILQACRLRISKPDYISCPSCGRTLFDIQKTTALVREKTAHLKGVKIAVMGCIVNGPGEMADADYGYVGAAKGKITLYKNKTPVKKNIPEENAVEELLLLIESDL